MKNFEKHEMEVINFSNEDTFAVVCASVEIETEYDTGK